MCIWVCGVGEGKELGGTFKRHMKETNNNDENNPGERANTRQRAKGEVEPMNFITLLS